MDYAIYDEIIGTVRCSAGEEWYSIEDFIRQFCPDLPHEEIVTTIIRITQKLGHIFHEHPQMAVWGNGDRHGWSNCLAVNELNLLDVLSLLPGEKARRIWEAANARAESEARRFEFVEANRSAWEAEGQSYQERREALGLNAEEVARGIGVSRTLVRNFERGKPILRAELVMKAYDLFLTNFILMTSWGKMIDEAIFSGPAEQAANGPTMPCPMDLRLMPVERLEDTEMMFETF